MNAQYFINKLREGHYSEALNINLFIYQKYGRFVGKISGDYILPLLIYELAWTDFNEDDLIHLNNLNTLLKAYQLNQSQPGYNFISLVSAVSCLMTLNFDSRQSLKKLELTSQAKLKSFVEDKQLSRVQLNPVHQELIFSKSRSNIQINQDIEYIYEPIANSLKKLQECERLKDAVSRYVEYLEKEMISLINEAYPINLHSKKPNDNDAARDTRYYTTQLNQLQMSPIYRSRVCKLKKSYQAIVSLKKSLGDSVIINYQIRLQASESLQICAANGPSWNEKKMIEKIKDILSFGLRPLFHFFSQSNKQKALANSVRHYLNESSYIDSSYRRDILV